MRNFLVIGFGNELRSDDGLGPKIAAAIEHHRWPGVRVMSAHQLTPELAEPISNADAVVFIDAALGQSDSVQVEPLSIAGPLQFRAHASSPELLLSLASQVYGKCPPAWSMTVPAADFSFGDQLSSPAQAALAAALLAFQQLWNFCSISSLSSGGRRRELYE